MLYHNTQMTSHRFYGTENSLTASVEETSINWILGNSILKKSAKKKAFTSLKLLGIKCQNVKTITQLNDTFISFIWEFKDRLH